MSTPTSPSMSQGSEHEPELSMGEGNILGEDDPSQRDMDKKHKRPKPTTVINPKTGRVRMNVLNAKIRQQERAQKKEQAEKEEAQRELKREERRMAKEEKLRLKEEREANKKRKREENVKGNDENNKKRRTKDGDAKKRSKSKSKDVAGDKNRKGGTKANEKTRATGEKKKILVNKKNASVTTRADGKKRLGADGKKKESKKVSSFSFGERAAVQYDEAEMIYTVSEPNVYNESTLKELVSKNLTSKMVCINHLIDLNLVTPGQKVMYCTKRWPGLSTRKEYAGYIKRCAGIAGIYDPYSFGSPFFFFTPTRWVTSCAKHVRIKKHGSFASKSNSHCGKSMLFLYVGSNPKTLEKECRAFSLYDLKQLAIQIVNGEPLEGTQKMNHNDITKNLEPYTEEFVVYKHERILTEERVFNSELHPSGNVDAKEKKLAFSMAKLTEETEEYLEELEANGNRRKAEMELKVIRQTHIYNDPSEWIATRDEEPENKSRAANDRDEEDEEGEEMDHDEGDRHEQQKSTLDREADEDEPGMESDEENGKSTTKGYESESNDEYNRDSAFPHIKSCSNCKARTHCITTGADRYLCKKCYNANSRSSNAATELEPQIVKRTIAPKNITTEPKKGQERTVRPSPLKRASNLLMLYNRHIQSAQDSGDESE